MDKCPICNTWFVVCPCCDAEFCPDCKALHEEIEEEEE